MDSRPGQYACSQSGSCALAGAAAFFAGIPGAVVVINGQLWCYFYAKRHTERQSTVAGERILCSQVDGTAIVYGTEEQLMKTLLHVKTSLEPELVAIINSCAVSLIGDDTAGIAAQVALDCPVVCVDSSGLSGGFAEGYREAAKAYFNHIPMPAPEETKRHTINLIGGTVGYYNAAADFDELHRMLTLGGCKLIAAPGAGSSTHEIAKLRQAELNVVLHHELGEQLAQMLYERYGIPYVTLLPPFGLQGTLAWSEAIIGALSSKPESWDLLKQEIAGLEGEIHRTLLEVQRLWGNLWFDQIVVAAPESIALAVAKAVRYELADTRRLAVIVQGNSSWNMPIAGIETLISSNSTCQVQAELACLQGGLLLGSSNETAGAQQLGIKKMVRQNIALPVLDEVIITPSPLMGITGMRCLTERLWNKYIRLQELLD